MTEFGFDALTNYLLIGAALFALGLIGFLSRRNMIVMFLSAEVMLQGVALSLIGFGRFHDNWTGLVFTIVILTVAACEAGLALALILLLFSKRESLDVSLWSEIRESSAPKVAEDPTNEAEPIEVIAGPESYPRLTPAGAQPVRAGQGRGWEVRRD